MKRLSAVLAAIVLITGCVGGSSQSPLSTAFPSSLAPTTAPTPVPTPTATPAASRVVSAADLAKASIPRVSADPSRATAAANAINAFGFDLYAMIANGQGNVVLSPASVALALSMARAGALGSTATQMDNVLHGAGSDELGDAINALDATLGARSGTFKDGGGEDQQVLLRIANAIFSQRDMALQAAYLDTLASRFGSGIWRVDFAADPEAARQEINAWVAEQTEQRIPEVLRPGQISAGMRLALANAIYLKAAWLNPFPTDATTPGTFTLLDGNTVQVPMMRLQARVDYATGNGWRAVELPYVGGDLAMTIILPDNLTAFEAHLDATTLDAIVGSLKIERVNLTMPTFDTESRTELSDVLTALGMPAALDAEEADFSGITTEERLYIGLVIHQANITVDEAGTEAAAATIVGMDTAGGDTPPTPLELRVDRPFLFVLRDIPTGAVIFMGRVADPSSR